MSQKVKQSKASKIVDEPSGSGNIHPKVWRYIRYYWYQNEQLWQRVAELEHSNTEYDNQNAPKLDAPHKVFAEMRDLRTADRETFVAFYLDTKLKVIAREIISVGTLNSSQAHPREVFKGALINNANCIILAHNHPSGDPTPSRDDIHVTKRLKEAGKIIGIKILDHIVVGKDSYDRITEV